MSSRPTTPTDHSRTPKVPQDTPVPISSTQSRSNQTSAIGQPQDMLATARFPGHTPYTPSSRHAALFTRHGEPTISTLSENIFEHQRQTMQPFGITSAAQPVTLASSSGDTQHREPTSTSAEAGSPKRTSSRLRRHTTEEVPRQSSTEAGPVEDEAPAPPRKKRTRTLTTAHQSSVLLGLLAKTPFPTTAERESVGRQIGLTARKVQVWFQNQRQKQKKSAQAGTLATADQGAAASAPLPLSRQPGFSALHAARMGVAAPSSAASYPSHHHPATSLQSAGSYAPPISSVPAGQREPLPAPYSSVYSRSFAEHTPYYQLPPGSNHGHEGYIPSPATTSSPPRPRTSHSHIVPSPFSSSPYAEAYPHPPATGIGGGIGGNSYGHVSHHSTSQGTASDDHSLPPQSETGVHYPASPGDAWRYKPLPPLPPSRSPRDRSLNWEHQSGQHEFRPPPVLPSRSRAFSNPDALANEVEIGGHFTHARGASSTLPPPSSYGQPRYANTMLPTESSAPSSYHGHSEYRPVELAPINPVMATTGTEGHYGLRYGESHPSPTIASTSSSLSYPEGVPLTSQHAAGRVAYSPIDRRRNRLSYDSSFTGRSQLGKRSWSSEDERSTKRARTDDGHIAVPVAPSPLSFPAPHNPAIHSSASYSLTPVNPTLATGTQGSLGVQMPSAPDAPRQPENSQAPYYPSSDNA